jgi:multimeric flavodoxin WrbA
LEERVYTAVSPAQNAIENRDRRCVIDKDIVNECIGKMLEADGIILASPTYFADLTPELKALIDRAGFVAKANKRNVQTQSWGSRCCGKESRINSCF